MLKKSPVRLTVVVDVNHRRPNPISVMSETPPMHGRWLYTLGELLHPVRDRLENGLYTVVSTQNEGCEVVGPDPDSCDLIESRITGELENILPVLADTLAMYDVTNEVLVEKYSAFLANTIIGRLQLEPALELTPGFAQIIVGCPGHGRDDVKFALQIAERLRTSDPATRAALKGVVTNVTEAFNLPKVGPFTIFVSGCGCASPFGDWFNNRMQRRFDDLTPEILVRGLDIALAKLDPRSSRDNAIRVKIETFNLAH